MKNWLIFFFILTSHAFAEKRVEMYTNFSISYDALTHTMQGEGLTVIGGNADRFKKKRGLKKYLPSFVQKDPNLVKVVFYNLTKKQAKYPLNQFVPKEKLVLFMWEPPTVLPMMYEKKMLDQFGKVFTWDDDLVDNKKFFKFNYPSLRPMLDEIPSFSDKKLLTLVNTNLESEHPNELYSKRKAFIEFCEERDDVEFEFYGRKWNETYKNYRGPCADKIDTIKHYRFSICFENIYGKKGYITEKIFDCFAAGNVPVYWGAPNIATYIPKECYIDMREFASFNELCIFLEEMPEEIYKTYIQAIKAFLQSKEAQVFSAPHFEKIFQFAIADR